jgi:hypothetical protein
MPLPPDIEVQFYAPDGTPRNIDPDRLTGATWELSDRGGMAQGSIPLAYGFDLDSCGVRGGDTVKIWVGTEAHPRFVGQVAVPERTLAEAESWQLTCYGPMEDGNHVRLGTLVEVQPGGADLAHFAAVAFAEYQVQRPGGVCGLPVGSDFAPVGVSRETVRFDNPTFREAMDQLCEQAPGLLVWGWEVNPATGALVCFLRKRTSGIGWQLDISERVKVLSDSRDFQQILNRASPLKGGDAKFANLLAPVVGDNTSFEEPIVATDETGGNVLPDASFEDRQGAPNTLLESGASFKATSLGEGQARTGDDMVLLDGVGEKVRKISFTVTGLAAGQKWDAGAYVRRTEGPNPGSAAVTLTWLDAGGSVTGTAVTVPAAPGNAAWGDPTKIAAAVVPAGAVGLEISVTNTGGSVVVDDLFAYRADAVIQKKWTANKGSGTANFSIDWAYRGVRASHGRTCIAVRATGVGDDNDNDLSIEPEGGEGAVFDVSPNATYRIACAARRFPGEANHPKLIQRLTFYDESGDQVDEDDNAFAAGSGWADWTRISGTATAPANAVKCRARWLQRSDGAVLLDAMSVQLADAPDEFIPASTFERYVTAEEVCAPGSVGALSFGLYGSREEEVSAPDIRQWDATAQQYLADLFNKRGRALLRPRLEIAHEWERIITPGSGLLLRVSGLPEAFPDTYPSTVTYSAGEDGLSVSVPLGDEEPTLATRLAAIGKVSGSTVSVGGGGGTSVSGGGGSGGVGTGSGIETYDIAPFTNVTPDATTAGIVEFITPKDASGAACTWTAEVSIRARVAPTGSNVTYLWHASVSGVNAAWSGGMTGPSTLTLTPGNYNVTASYSIASDKVVRVYCGGNAGSADGVTVQIRLIKQ